MAYQWEMYKFFWPETEMTGVCSITIGAYDFTANVGTSYVPVIHSMLCKQDGRLTGRCFFKTICRRCQCMKTWEFKGGTWVIRQVLHPHVLHLRLHFQNVKVCVGVCFAIELRLHLRFQPMQGVGGMCERPPFEEKSLIPTVKLKYPAWNFSLWENDPPLEIMGTPMTMGGCVCNKKPLYAYWSQSILLCMNWQSWPAMNQGIMAMHTLSMHCHWCR
jgi:hypothetical protein